jgi:energy-coupling factor transport system ATP-binding protein
MESLGIRPDVMRRRVEETLDLLGLADVRDRPLLSLSAGQQQRVAIGSVLTVQPQVLVLDEPTSALDPAAAEEVLATLTRLVHDLGLTVVVAEHRLERVVQYADTVAALWPGRPVVHGAPAEVLSVAPVRPPVVELAQLAHWKPLPLSVRDARRCAEGLRARLSEQPAPVRRRRPTGDVVVAARAVTAAYGDLWALRGVDLALRAGEVTALMGRNGAGKSTLLRLFAGLRAPQGGSLSLPGERGVALVPQEPADLLWAATVAAECTEADADSRVISGATLSLVRRLAPEIDADAHPRDLSEGQRLMLCLAVMLVGRPPVVALDEPTRGLDYGAKQRLVEVLRELVAAGTCVVLATHDVELVAEVADRVVILAEGEVVADGEAADVVTSSPAFAPQVAKVLAPFPVLTVNEARAALA